MYKTSGKKQNFIQNKLQVSIAQNNDSLALHHYNINKIRITKHQLYGTATSDSVFSGFYVRTFQRRMGYFKVQN